MRGIRTLDPSVRVGEDRSCLKPRGHCDPHIIIIIIIIIINLVPITMAARSKV
jgi:hypothetical protein